MFFLVIFFDVTCESYSYTALDYCSDSSSADSQSSSGTHSSSGVCQNVTSSDWNELIKQENQCYQVVCDEDDDKWIVKKRESAIGWENRKDECNNESGTISWSSCNSTQDTVRVCVNDKCTEKKKMMETSVSVEIDIDETIQVTEINLTELLDILNVQCGIDTNGMVIGFETDEEGYIFRIIIYVENEETAIHLVEAVNELDKGANCQSGILCRTKEARIITTNISLGYSIHMTMKNVINYMMMIITVSIILMGICI